MKKPKTQKPKTIAKREKPLKLEMSFDDAMRRIVNVKRSEIKKA